ncbi:metalloreductase-like protein transmembrane component [Mytilinidion resinicola]|uniref:ferric-chelate reductase (NADPH) n=1 Tax=Mytilinidion resinicola TaxID=574789 RepID=A0A6A6YNT8_9PEZI|nr:metalloreductase-like protein transmembrane component [Mytilinidion resinicola]KAF2810556.1 metalloreductase-like protein transmembrane component [Mytilinidion resinicola]
MPAIEEIVARRAGEALHSFENAVSIAEREASLIVSTLAKRINIPYNSSSPAGLIEANTRDPWNKSGKYALGMVYFCLILLVASALLRYYHLFTDKIRTVLHQEELKQVSENNSPTDYELANLYTAKSTKSFFPSSGILPQQPKPRKEQSSVSSLRPVNYTIAFFRYIFYRPVPQLRLRKGWSPIVFPSLAVTIIVSAMLVFVTLYCFVPQPLYWQSIAYGSPPLAIRAGMLAVAMMPWIVGLSMKANIISLITGIGHERLNVLHRWGGYLCLFLSLIHTIPFYITPVWDQGALQFYQSLFKGNGNFYVYGTGVASLVPLIFLCVHSLPQLRNWMYELFVTLHVPVAIVFLGMLFWHCSNYLTSWSYLWATLTIWLTSYLIRLFFLNWTNPFKLAWLVGDEAAVTIMPENAIKITVPTQMRWRPGQYVYLRMPGISVFENHPFTIASLCSEDFPSEYGEGYRDMVLVFRPFGGFTRKVLRKAIEHGPWHTYRAFLDGPYGGMQRRIEAFDHVVLIAGGSGITAIVSQLLDLIKRMRDGKAVTKHIHVIWALKRPETMEWFKEELRICREYAPPDTVRCEFYITAAKRMTQTGQLVSARTPTRPVSLYFHDKVNDAFQDIANKRDSRFSTKRHSALIRDEAAGDEAREKELRAENEDAITALPQAHVRVAGPKTNLPSTNQPLTNSNAIALAAPVPTLPLHARRRNRNLSVDVPSALEAAIPGGLDTVALNTGNQVSPVNPAGFDFGFPSTPTEFQKNLMRFAFLPAAVKKKDGWSTEYGRPDIPYTLKQLSKDFGRRTCVFVCGPPTMRIDVSNTVAELQKEIWSDPDRDELFLHAENYAV